MKHLSTVLSLFCFCFVSTVVFGQAQTGEIITMQTKAEPAGPAQKPAAGQAILSGVAEPMNTPQADLSAPTHLRECEGDEEENEEVERMKEEMVEERAEEVARFREMGTIPNPFEPNTSSALAAVPPIVFSSFNATGLGSGNPPDNTLAISNGGSIIACINSRVAVYNTVGTQIGVWDLGSFFNYSGSGVVNDFYDPNVIYDPGADRFVFTCSVGRQAANSRICVAFSKTNNPAGGWWIYFLSGNPLNNGCWWDYPRIGVNTTEVFVTGNLYTNAGNYNNSVVYQIPKTTGYAGSTVNYGIYWSLNGSPFAVTPVSSGNNSNYGYPFYLVSHAAASGSTTKLYKVSNSYASGAATITYNSINVPAYAIGGNAGQKGSTETLNTGDCRAFSTFFLNGLIHYVFHSKVPGSGTFNGIFYHRLNPTALSVTSKTIYSTSYDLVYPCVAWVGTVSTNKSVLISFEYSTTGTFYPGVGAINVDDALVSSSNWVNCAVGASYVDLTGAGAGLSRWGDYTGICRKRNTSPARVWGCGSFGNASNNYTAKIFQIGTTNFTGGSGDRSNTGQEVVSTDVNVSLYPNPAAQNAVQLSIEKPLAGSVEVEIVSLAGRVMLRMQQDEVPQGHSQFQLPTEKLTEGAYFVRIFTNHQLIRNEKLVILR